MSTLNDTWHGIADEIKKLDAVRTRGGSLVYTTRVRSPAINQFKPAIYVEHQKSGRADPTKWVHTYLITVLVKGLDAVTLFEKSPESVQARVAEIAEGIQTGLEENTLADHVAIGGVYMSDMSPITGIEGDQLMCGCSMTAQCLAMIDPDAEPELTRLWRLYYGTRGYNDGEYTDVTDWKLLCNGLGALQHLPSTVHTAFKNASAYPVARTYTLEERRITALVSKSNTDTWGMYLGKTIDTDTGIMPHMHIGIEFGDLPRHALLLMNRLSNGQYYKWYAPKVSCLPAADISDKSPHMTLTFSQEGDDDNLETTDENIIGHSIQDAAAGPWT